MNQLKARSTSSMTQDRFIEIWMSPELALAIAEMLEERDYREEAEAIRAANWEGYKSDESARRGEQ